MNIIYSMFITLINHVLYLIFSIIPFHKAIKNEPGNLLLKLLLRDNYNNTILQI